MPGDGHGLMSIASDVVSVPCPLRWQTSDRKTGALDLNMGKMAANGPFTPIVIAMRSVVGEKKFNQIRGKGITLHSQVQGEL